jgi:cell division septation protein DedD
MGLLTDDVQDTEITLTTGKLLGIFFGLVLICSVFFTLGYVVGHANGGGEKTDIVGPVPSTGTPSGKPSATNRTNNDLAPVSSSTPAPPAVVPASQPQTSIAPSPAPRSTDSTYTPASAPDVKPATGGTYTVQVAAVSKQEDAQSLVSALQKKQYPVFVANVPGDSLFHVQVGPFSDPKEAEAMRVRLAGEGYDAIVKK